MWVTEIIVWRQIRSIQQLSIYFTSNREIYPEHVNELTVFIASVSKFALKFNQRQNFLYHMWVTETRIWRQTCGVHQITISSASNNNNNNKKYTAYINELKLSKAMISILAVKFNPKTKLSVPYVSDRN